MTFQRAPIADAWILGIERHTDERGHFARFWSASELAERTLDPQLEHVSISYNRRAGTIRGLHHQAAPRAETKIVRCVHGAIFDVLLDLRAESATFKQWFARELSAENGTALYIPKGVAHGFQTLTDDAEVMYFISEHYDPTLARGVRWNDPAFGIDWPREPTVIAERDRGYPDFRG